MNCSSFTKLPIVCKPNKIVFELDKDYYSPYLIREISIRAVNCKLIRNKSSQIVKVIPSKIVVKTIHQINRVKFKVNKMY